MTQRELERKAKENKLEALEKAGASLKKDIVETIKDIENNLKENGKEFNAENVAVELYKSFTDEIDYANEFTAIMFLSRLNKLWKTAGTDWREFAY